MRGSEGTGVLQDVGWCSGGAVKVWACYRI